jgi:hypothetical protein
MTVGPAARIRCSRPDQVSVLSSDHVKKAGSFSPSRIQSSTGSCTWTAALLGPCSLKSMTNEKLSDFVTGDVAPSELLGGACQCGPISAPTTDQRQCYGPIIRASPRSEPLEAILIWRTGFHLTSRRGLVRERIPLHESAGRPLDEPRDSERQYWWGGQIENPN